ncbi:MAG: di-heme oxidoredictase family protein [Pseudomonadota bacterium]|nr:di-heme oxidoredictase family protein [Pseudomonadota bacterium]
MSLLSKPRPRTPLWGLLLCLLPCWLYAFGEKSGGNTSVSKTDNDAFSLPAANLSFEGRLDFSVGNSFFRNPWVIAPATTTARDGLGPLFNTNGCQNCHIRDGRGHLPAAADDNAVSLLVRLSLKPNSPEDWQRIHQHGVIPHPDYGDQLQDFAIPGVEAEAQLHIEYEYHEVTLSGGQVVRLRKPILSLSQLAYGPLDQQVAFSMRIAPPMIGLGLLEALSDAQIKAQADPEDADGDGISGRWNPVWDVTRQQLVLGRFGWKAEQPTLRQQNAAAFNGDIGITSSLFPAENCTSVQAACRQAPQGGVPEVSDKILNLVTFYTSHLAVPKRRNADDPQVKAGEAVFMDAGCAGCHRVQYVTPALADRAPLSEQTIHPYTDLLLHDMGPELADDRPVFSASGSEWRTPPLWGIGLTGVVSGFEHYLHDGRAQSLLEAILWHGGEGKPSRDYVVQTSPVKRDALLAFLNSL